MFLADRMIAGAIMLLALYFMWHAYALPIGWNGATGGPGGGAFPFWLSAIMFVVAAGILFRTFTESAITSWTFDMSMLRPLISVIVALTITIVLIPLIGAYLALPIFMFWYLRIFGQNGWTVSILISLLTPVGLFFFFEATLKILLPKGITEPFFFPLYAMFF